MKLKIMMRTMSILVVLITIFIIVLYEPKIEEGDVGNSEEITNGIVEENVEEISLSTDQEILQGYKSDVLTISLDNVISNLTLDERSVVKGILDKLSVIDCAKINSILNSGRVDSEQEALLYIKKRLVEEDYKRLEGILNQYIDLV